MYPTHPTDLNLVGIVNLSQLDTVDAEEGVATRSAFRLETELQSEVGGRGELNLVLRPLGAGEGSLVLPLVAAAGHARKVLTTSSIGVDVDGPVLQ